MCASLCYQPTDQSSSDGCDLAFSLPCKKLAWLNLERNPQMALATRINGGLRRIALPLSNQTGIFQSAASGARVDVESSMRRYSRDPE